jgi:hypothetical protein
VKKEKAPERVLRNRCTTVFRDSSHFIFKVRILFFGEEKQHFSPWQHSFRMEKENAAKRGY